MFQHAARDRDARIIQQLGKHIGGSSPQLNVPLRGWDFATVGDPTLQLRAPEAPRFGLRMQCSVPHKGDLR
eukprot:457507-Alexandrium_andersonii.AAC.1